LKPLLIFVVEEILKELDWREGFFYVSLFALVGGLEHAGVIKRIAEFLIPIISGSMILDATVVSRVTAPIAGIVEHDAYILTLL
jgi:Na+/H+ antiporter NhaD/arsenite permease-like protein